MPVEAIAPLQEQNQIIAGGIVAAVLARAVVVWLLGAGEHRSARLAAIETELLSAWEPSRRPGGRATSSRRPSPASSGWSCSPA